MNKHKAFVATFRTEINKLSILSCAKLINSINKLEERATKYEKEIVEFKVA